MEISSYETNQNIVNFIDDALAIQVEKDKDTATLGYMARILVQAAIPHSKPKENSFTISIGYDSLTMIANPKYGLPYGALGRLLMIWIITEVNKTQNPKLILGDNLNEFMWKLGIVPTGSKWENVSGLKEQMKKLISFSIQFKYEDSKQLKIKNIVPVKEAKLFWTPQNPEQGTSFKSTITLSKSFFEEIANNPIV